MEYRRQRPQTKRPAWQKCPCCDDFWCNIHECHTHECPCPPIDEWFVDPYSPKTDEELFQLRLTMEGMDAEDAMPDV